jgi:sialate O-acetylesterase
LVLIYVNLLGCASLPLLGEGADASSMEISSGLYDYQVLQRDDNNRGKVFCMGTCKAVGPVLARVVQVKRLLPIIAWHEVGKADNGIWSATVEDLPMGGPYRVELKIGGVWGKSLACVSIDNVLVGDLWILAGQSNMQGVGDVVEVEAPSVWVHSYGMNECWSVAEEPLHWLNESPNVIHHRLQRRGAQPTPEEIAEARKRPRGKPLKGAGLGLPFAKELCARTKVPIGLVPCAHGGTSMDQWDPGKRDLGGESLYGAMYGRFKAVGGKVKGVLWYQGESDSGKKTYKTFREKFGRFIGAVRKDFNDPDLPFYYVQIGNVVTLTVNQKTWCSIREDQRTLAGELYNVEVVGTVDLELDDCIHIGTQGLKRLGRRLALIADRELFGNTTVEIGPRLDSVKLEAAERDRKPWLIQVEFDKVNGRLLPNRHIGGFSLRDAEGNEVVEFYDVVVDSKSPNTVLCQIDWRQKLPAELYLWYGYSSNPYCNLVDEEDMGVLAFGPIALEGFANKVDK